MRVGISVLGQKGQNVWSSGLIQNIYHLACLLDAIPFVERVFLLNCGDPEAGHPAGAEDFAARFALVRPADATDMLDVAIEMGGAIDPEWSRRFRARGGRIVFHDCGNPYMAIAETIYNDKGFFGDTDRCDEIWMFSRDRRIFRMVETIYRRPVREVPFLWAPHFLDRSAEQLRQHQQHEGKDVGPFGYAPGQLSAGSARAAIFEPNHFPGKMGLIPLLICEEAERRAAGTVAHVDFLNGQHMTSHNSFIFFMKNLSLYESGRIAIHGRDYFAHVMMRGGNVVVSHQLDWDMNYLYFDALHGGYPLVHNAPSFSDAGYYYDQSDIEAGATALIDAVSNHDRDLESYRAGAQAKIAAHSPLSPANINAYARRLVGLTRGRMSGWAA